jgi:hypothetical protein
MVVDEGDVVLWDANALDIEGNLDYEDLIWEDLCQTPGRQRASGKLGRPPPSPKPHEPTKRDVADLHDLLGDKANLDDVPATLTIRFPHVMTDLSGCPYTAEELWVCAEYQTRYLDPSYDVEQIESATKKRMDAYKRLITKHGGKIVH